MLVRGVIIVLVTALVAVALGFGYTQWRFGQIGKLGLDDVLSLGRGGEMNVLLVGSDGRDELSPEDVKKYGSASKVPGQRSDTIMLLHVDSKNEKASVLSLPRDLYVSIPGNGKGKINSSFSLGGPDLLIRTIKQNFNIDIDHYAQVNFESFEGLVNAVDGVSIPVTSPIRDYDTEARRNQSGLNIQSTGCVSLSGEQALAYVRSRHYQYFDGGRWRSDPSGDLGRINRQQDFIRRLLHKGVDKAKNPATLNSLLATGVQNVQLDDNFGLSDITKLAKRFKSLDPSQVEMMTIPNTGTSIDGVSYQVIDEEQKQATIDRFLGVNQPAVTGIPASSINVRVLNGSGKTGAAADAADGIRALGYLVAGSGNNDANVAKTTIRYGTDQKEKAETLATALGGDIKLQADDEIEGADVVLIIGSEFAGVPGAPTGESAPTTVPAPSKFVPNVADTCA